MAQHIFNAAVDHFEENPHHDQSFGQYAAIVLNDSFRYSVAKLSRNAITNLVKNSSRLRGYSGHTGFALVVGQLVPVITNTIIDLIEDHHNGRAIRPNTLLSEVVHNAHGALQAQGIHHTIESHFPGRGDLGTLFSLITLDVLQHSSDHD